MDVARGTSTTSTPGRTCNKCGKTYPATSKYFYSVAGKLPTSPRVMRRTCKQCWNQHTSDARKECRGSRAGVGRGHVSRRDDWTPTDMDVAEQTVLSRVLDSEQQQERLSKLGDEEWLVWLKREAEALIGSC